MSAWLIIPPPMSWSMPIDGLGFSPQPASQPLIWAISGAWAALIWVARSVTLASMPSLAKIMSLIATACWWCGIIAWANMTSASLCGPAAGVAEVAGELAAEGLPLEPWSMPGMVDGSLLEQPVRPVTARAAATARLPRRLVRRVMR